MKTLWSKGLFLLVLVPYLSFSQVIEVPDPNLNDIAMVMKHPQYEAVIIYNPIKCQQIGHACGFFRTHEYGHVVLGHQFVDPGTPYRPQLEAQADEWAAANAHPQEILAAYYLFMNGSSGNWQIYGHPMQRAARLRQYAINYNTWIGS